ncbi:hypothetical protein CcCBS67573_g07007 [Chytriomyces confervae]|uniref:Beta-mannosidase B n=1 Tax=Chytriomyces confervae TaxID=246404 RepID=A0A507EYP0_9FUNG|nr:hypothetical protein CcCBS67573_g07007 [Chytriomyces confervae]
MQALAMNTVTLDLSDASEWALSGKFVETEGNAAVPRQQLAGLSMPIHIRSHKLCTHLDLMHAGIICDPFIGGPEGEKNVEWVGWTDWSYERVFYMANPYAASPLPASLLIIDEVDTVASVYLNGILVGKSENMFVPLVVDVSHALKLDADNTLRVEIAAPAKAAFDREKMNVRRSVWNGDASRVYLRKAQYHWGWDWGPTLLTSAICDPRIVMYYARISALDWAISVHPSLASADVTFTATVAPSPSFNLSQSSCIFTIQNPDGSNLITKAVRPDCDDKFCFTLRIQKPKLWFPRGTGPQDRYTVTATLLHSASPVPLDKSSQKFGIRRVRLVETPLPPHPQTELLKTQSPASTSSSTNKTSFYFEINNIPVCIGGSNWIPADSFLSRLTPEKYIQWLKLVADGNQNMVRVWGGGVYEPNVFYETCDELGLLVWQDFMFACGAYPAHESFRESVQEEARQQVARLKKFASVCIFAGNNEDYSFAESENLGYDAHCEDEAQWLASGFPARYIYERVLPQVIKEVCAGGDVIAYRPGSPWSPGGRFSSDLNVGDAHQWNVWHGTQEPYQNYGKLAGRFISEFGMQGFPSLSTCKSFFPANTPVADMGPFSAVVENHNKAAGFAKRISGYLFENLRFGTGLEAFVYATQLMQSEAISTAYKLWRREWGHDGNRKVGGALVWQMNDCWPCVSWSIVDYYLRPKASYYSVKRQLEPVTIGLARIMNADGSAIVEAWIMNNQAQKDVIGRLQVTVFDYVNGTMIGDPIMYENVQVACNSVLEVGSVQVPTSSSTVIVAGRLLDLDVNVLFATVDWPQPLKYLPVAVPSRGIEVAFEPKLGRAGTVTLKLSCARPVKGVWMKFFRNEEEVVDGIVVSDNMVDLVPGHVLQVSVEGWTDGMTVRLEHYNQDGVQV